jgi:hypothetical protein
VTDTVLNGQVRTELPVRLAHRIRDLQNLPYIVGTHPSLAKVYGLYVDAFERSDPCADGILQGSEHDVVTLGYANILLLRRSKITTAFVNS